MDTFWGFLVRNVLQSPQITENGPKLILVGEMGMRLAGISTTDASAMLHWTGTWAMSPRAKVVFDVCLLLGESFFSAARR